MNVLWIAVGVLGVVWILNDLFKSVLVPRAVDDEWRISVMFVRFAWITWRRVGRAMRAGSRREDFLGSYAPLAFILLVALWLIGLILSYGLILFGLRDQITPIPRDFGTTLYFAGTSVFTIGYGDYVGTGTAARIAVLSAGASGIGTVAITIAFLYAVVGAFQQRERFVLVLDARAGAPPSGVALLETYATLNLLDELPALFRDSENWVADVLGSHLAYPLLMFFRSSHRDESWIAALGALLDAGALLVTVIDGLPTGEARLFLDVGMHLTHDLASYYDLPAITLEPATADDRAALCARLAASGFGLRQDSRSWERFFSLRAEYARSLRGVGKRWLIATAPLIGERTSLPGHAS